MMNQTIPPGSAENASSTESTPVSTPQARAAMVVTGKGTGAATHHSEAKSNKPMRPIPTEEMGAGAGSRGNKTSTSSPVTTAIRAG